MRQFRGNCSEVFITPKIKLETDNAYLFIVDGGEEWIPKKWITSFNKNKSTFIVKEYWSTEVKQCGFKLKNML